MTITAKRISDPTTDKPYFILTELLEDKADFEESQINVRITDGAHFWRKEGQRRLSQPDKWMANTYRAITSPTAESFEYQFSERDGNLKFTIRWRQPGMTGRVKADIVLQLCEGPEHMRSLLDCLFGTLSSLQVSHDAHAKSVADFKEEALRNSKLVEEYATHKEAREEELYAKFSAVLNEKKAKMRELKHRVEDLERKLQDDERSDATDAGSQGARGALDEYNSVYDAETEPSEENEAATLLPMPDTIGQQTQRPQQAASLMDAEATTSRVFTPAERAAMLDAPTQSQEVADDDMEPAPDREIEDMPVAGPAAPAKPRTITKRRRR
ncbi:hypothetical protein COCSUDRAFT_67773 [Coccomyxa subellipsoidea C-169]|uniref:XRCC4 coiled-coil domain-containing protein n=1 Tax=Coccomyxa subellipsoidea (strain C-169) TaxID=574566 RepID=I0YMV9_COCSC|nr:hypothetical protein COCSUDRAFT_67773 [Coccomyxa subellipsoidea C-169]EIE19728.1 hypothetical protein COCSUDRAFT_67773 [Coccomyxa subellipsoidea C-169]|eukprot:XP_005644272.1 hypothetical protein COCSUDRAFT_67773 [Coccomyxa subellipsoidea C-169]